MGDQVPSGVGYEWMVNVRLFALSRSMKLRSCVQHSHHSCLESR